MGISHQGERGSGASIVKLRWERSRHTRSASARRGPGFVSGTRFARLQRAVEIGGVQADEGPADLPVQGQLAGELADLLALGGRGRREVDPRAAHEGERRGPERVGGREQRAVLDAELEVLERSAKFRTRNALGWWERWTSPSIWLTSCRATISQPAVRRSASRVQNATRALGSVAVNSCTSATKRASPGRGVGRRRKVKTASSEANAARSVASSTVRSSGPRELPQREPRLDVACLPCGLETVEEGGHVGVRGVASCPPGARRRAAAPPASARSPGVARDGSGSLCPGHA